MRTQRLRQERRRSGTLRSAMMHYGDSSAAHGTRRHRGDTGSGYVNDSCGNFYNPMDLQPPPSARRHHALKLVLAGACLLLSVLVLVLIGRLLFKHTEDQHQASVSQALEPQKERKTTEQFLNRFVDIDSYTTESTGEKDGNKLKYVCKTRPPINYTVEGQEQIYFEYRTKYNDTNEKYVSFSNDSEIMERLIYQRRIDETIITSVPPKTILILSRLDIEEKDYEENIKKRGQSVCSFTTDKSRFESADAVIFRDRDLNISRKRESSKQIWIYNTLKPNDINLSADIKSMFNLSGTYDFKSHIPILPMYWNEAKPPPKPREVPGKNHTDNIVRLVVYNNNCEDEKKFYEKYKNIIEVLEGDKKEIIVEWFNFLDCSKNSFNITRKYACHNLSSAQCYKKLESEIKFALAFEISNADYISERFFDPLNNTIIPIAIGSTQIKYEAVSPKDSFIYLLKDWMSLVPLFAAIGGTSYATYRLFRPKSPVNPEIKKSEAKVVDSFNIEDLGDKAVFCRCWRSKKFPYCDGSHGKYNQIHGDNVGPLIVSSKK